MRADAAACAGSRASHQGLAEGYAQLIAAERSRRDQAPPAAADRVG